MQTNYTTTATVDPQTGAVGDVWVGPSFEGLFAEYAAEGLRRSIAMLADREFFVGIAPRWTEQ